MVMEVKKRSHNVKEKNPNWVGDKATAQTGYTRAQRWFIPPEGKERHHIDGDPTNNDPENVEFHTRRSHMIKDGRMDALIARNKEGLMIGPRNANWKGEEAGYSAKRARDVRQRRREGETIPFGFTGRTHSEETKAKMSEARRLYWEKKKDVA